MNKISKKIYESIINDEGFHTGAHIKVHDDDCQKENSGRYTIGCLACIYELIKDSKLALMIEIADFAKAPTYNEKQRYLTKLKFFADLEKSVMKIETAKIDNKRHEKDGVGKRKMMGR